MSSNAQSTWSDERIEERNSWREHHETPSSQRCGECSFYCLLSRGWRRRRYQISDGHSTPCLTNGCRSLRAIDLCPDSDRTEADRQVWNKKPSSWNSAVVFRPQTNAHLEKDRWRHFSKKHKGCVPRQTTASKAMQLDARSGRFPRAMRCDGKVVCIPGRRDRVTSATVLSCTPNSTTASRAALTRVPYSER